MKLFISYRRRSWAFTQRLAEALTEVLDAQIFIDSSGIDDTDFEDSILNHLQDSDAVLVIVSEYTFDLERINDPEDWVRREIGTALKLDKPIVLAAVDGLYPPPPEQLPADVREITEKQGIAFYSDFFDPAVQKLADFVTKVTPIKRRAKKNVGLIAAAVAAVVTVLVIAMGVALLSRTTPTPENPLQQTVQFLVAQTLAAQTVIAANVQPQLPTSISTTVPSPQPTGTDSVTGSDATAVAGAPTVLALQDTVPPPVVPPTATITLPPPTDTPNVPPTQTPNLEQTVLAEVQLTSTVQAQEATALAQATATPTLTSTAPPPSYNTADLFPEPLQGKFRVTTDFGASIGSIRYPAIGLGTDVGTPIIAGGNGVVMLVTQCAKCTADKPNFASQGIAYSDPRALRDPAWGFGFGNFVIVRFAYKDLPGKLRAELDRQRLTNGYAYVHYAHLSRIDVKPKDQVSANTRIGLSGVTGNVTGPMLRIEVRVSAAADEKGFSSYTVVNPRLLYDM